MRLLEQITSKDPAIRDLAFESQVEGQPEHALLAEAARLDAFRRETGSLYHRVRALVFLSTLHRFHIAITASGQELIPYKAIEYIRGRRFDQAVSELLTAQHQHGASPALS